MAGQEPREGEGIQPQLLGQEGGTEGRTENRRKGRQSRVIVRRVDSGSGKYKKPRYYLREGIDDVAYFDDLCTAGIVCRFIKGAQLNRADYDIAKAALIMWDEANKPPEDPDSDDTI